MNARELRIGNYVQGDVKKCIEVTNKIMHAHIELNNQWLKPITLTKEWLLKFGFGNSGDGDNEFCSKKIIGDNKSIYELIFRINDGVADCVINEIQIEPEQHNSIAPKYIKHVHQLQNLYFALTGEELTFKN